MTKIGEQVHMEGQRFALSLQFTTPPAQLCPPRAWFLGFKVAPTPEIVFSGNCIPTRDEILDVLSSISAPAWMVGVIESVVGDIIYRRRQALKLLEETDGTPDH